MWHHPRASYYILNLQTSNLQNKFLTLIFAISNKILIKFSTLKNVFYVFMWVLKTFLNCKLQMSIMCIPSNVFTPRKLERSTCTQQCFTSTKNRFSTSRANSNFFILYFSKVFFRFIRLCPTKTKRIYSDVSRVD